MKYFVDYLPITTGNDLRLYTDGEDYCTDLYTALRTAKRFVFLTGLHFMADFRLIRRGNSHDAISSLALVLAETSKRGVEVFLLVNQFWKDESEVSGKFAPIRKKIMKSGELHGYLPETFRLFKLLRGFKNIHCRTDIHTNSDIFGTNHQKTVVIDDKVAFLGGIDLTFLDGDRWDTHDHRIDKRAIDRTQKFWHDIHLRAEGPAVQFVRDNFIQRWKHGNLHTLKKYAYSEEAAYAEAFPSLACRCDKEELKTSKIIKAIPNKKRPPLPSFPIKLKSKYQYPSENESSNTPTVQIIRSMPNKKNWHSEKPIWNIGSDNWERSCKDAYLIGIRAAKKYIYLENQWVADEDIWTELAVAAKRNNKNPDFRIIVMVPYEGLFAAGLGSNQELFIGSEMEDVINASFDEGTFGMYSLYKTAPRPVFAAQIYVHSKIMIVDDEWALIGSANAGGISLEGIRSGKDEPDTELSAIIFDKEFVSHFRKTLWKEHLKMNVDTKYQARDADQFRRQAGQPAHKSKVKFFPGYNKIKKGVPTITPWFLEPSPSTISTRKFSKHSRIVASFNDQLRWNLPVALMKASFKAYILPDAPAGYRFWYRWICILNVSDTETKRLRMLSLKYDKDEVFEYSDQNTVYIGEKSARYIDRRINDIKKGKILCRVQIIPVSESPDPNKKGSYPSLLLEYECAFMNAAFAKHNIDLGLLPK